MIKYSEDMQLVFDNRKDRLMDLLKIMVLTKEQKELLVIAMEFGYSAAFCQRTSDFNNSFTQEFRDNFKKITSSLE